MDKKGVSQIVTTILIILLVLAAIVIVWQAVKSTVESGAGTVTSQSKCIGIDLTIGSAVCNSSNLDGGNTTSIPITRGGDSAGGNSLTVSVTDATGNSKTATKTLAALGSVVVKETDTGLVGIDVGSTMVINTGITLTEGTICTGATKTITCVS